MKEIKHSILLEVTKILVRDGYYTIDYTVSKNGKRNKKFKYDSDYESWTEREWEKALINGEAFIIALQDYVDKIK